MVARTAALAVGAAARRRPGASANFEEGLYTCTGKPASVPHMRLLGKHQPHKCHALWHMYLRLLINLWVSASNVFGYGCCELCWVGCTVRALTPPKDRPCCRSWRWHCRRLPRKQVLHRAARDRLPHERKVHAPTVAECENGRLPVAV